MWATNTAGDGPSYLGLMDDGNLIIVQTPNFARHFPKQNVAQPGGNYGGKVTWQAFKGPNSPLASINLSSTLGGWCMEVPDGQISDNGHDPVSVAICNDSPQQNFVIAGEHGSVRALGRCLTNNGIGQPVTMDACDGQSRQNWASEFGVIRPADGSKICVEGPGSQFVEGRPLVMASCNGSAEQNWVEPRIKNFAGSGKCLGGANPNVDDNNKAVLTACTGQVNQQWYTSGWSKSSGYRGAFQTKNNQCLDVPNQNFAGGQLLQFFHCNNTRPRIGSGLPTARSVRQPSRSSASTSSNRITTMAQASNWRHATAPMHSNGIHQAGSRPMLRQRPCRQPSRLRKMQERRRPGAPRYPRAGNLETHSQNQ